MSSSDQDDAQGETVNLPSFDIELHSTGDPGSSFRTQNDPKNPYQRRNVLERKGSLDMRCNCVDFIHGTLASDDETLASLMVLEFRFTSWKAGRRFEHVTITVSFRNKDEGEDCVEVLNISPSERLLLLPTAQHVESGRNTNLELGAAAPTGGPTATASMGWTKAVSREQTDYMTIVGKANLLGRNWGNPNSVTWKLLENPATSDGVPESVRTAILLKRTSDEPFECTIKVDAKVDVRSKMERISGLKGRDPKDDPVIVNPLLKPTNRLRKYDADNLGACDLDSLVDVTAMRVLQGVTKETRLGHEDGIKA